VVLTSARPCCLLEQVSGSRRRTGAAPESWSGSRSQEAGGGPEQHQRAGAGAGLRKQEAGRSSIRELEQEQVSGSRRRTGATPESCSGSLPSRTFAGY